MGACCPKTFYFPVSLCHEFQEARCLDIFRNTANPTEWSMLPRQPPFSLPGCANHSASLVRTCFSSEHMMNKELDYPFPKNKNFMSVSFACIRLLRSCYTMAKTKTFEGILEFDELLLLNYPRRKPCRNSGNADFKNISFSYNEW